ncbi:LysR family transcriptional regulator [Xenorhabdus beddingii]|uniref:LysR family transcriptional regulator n=1 Tax=Xenorhabdus beddingii TaxID=40578 RepID=A0A1Y2SR00_9GAMM|nr:LysR substrate-binding domain-containing protein [Xenorhabdus beddingii]OTA21543.1 LysR family transcriptional regulator [Xenorhabdus beddingii]
MWPQVDKILQLLKNRDLLDEGVGHPGCSYVDLLKGMKVFVDVVDQGSMTAAAACSELTPQMVGLYIRNLEKQFGVKFLNRTTRQTGLTEAGKLFYQHCTQVLGMVNETQHVITSMNTEATGLLRITAPITFGTHVIAPSLGQFRKRYPRIDVDLFLTDSVMDLVADEIEIAIRIGVLKDSSLVARPLGMYRMAVAAAPEYLNERGFPSSPEELSEHDCIGFRLKMAPRHWSFQRDNTGFSVEVNDNLSINHGEALRQAALSGVGIVMQPEVLLSQDFTSGALVRLFTNEKLISKPVNMVYRQDKFSAAKMRAVIDFGLNHWKV